MLWKKKLASKQKCNQIAIRINLMLWKKEKEKKELASKQNTHFLETKTWDLQYFNKLANHNSRHTHFLVLLWKESLL